MLSLFAVPQLVCVLRNVADVVALSSLALLTVIKSDVASDVKSGFVVKQEI